MQKGQIRVQTENIFPVIKKFLYSEHEVFLRELVSNAVDASQKMKTIISLGEAKASEDELVIHVELDAKEKTISIIDHGIGMTAEEVDKYINQVAFSSAEDFLNKYKDANIIGHFGLGFYSAFMVSDKVEIYTKSYKDAPAVYWSCNGSPEFELYEIEKPDRGTKIVLHISEDNKEFLQLEKLRQILEKYGRFLPVPVFLKDKNSEEAAQQINNTQPIWIKKPAELEDEDYKKFYQELYPFSETPLFWIHLNVDYPFHLTGVLYFPKIKQSYEIQKNKIQLYSNQVFVTDEVKDIVPEFLMLLHGVIDSPDIPLNVSRSYLQGDPNVRKINAYITKKVADKLDEIFRSNRPSFEEKWESIGLFVKYGMITDDKFLEKASKFFVMQDAVDNKFYTLEEYKTLTEPLQKNKEGKLVILYTTDKVQQDVYIKACEKKGYKVVVMDSLIDAAFISQMELKWSDVHFVRVDADIVNNLIDKQEPLISVLSEEQQAELKELFSIEIPQLHIQVELKGLSPDDLPVIATRPEFSRRMKEMSAMNSASSLYMQMPDEVQLTVNTNHPIYSKILSEKDKALKEKKIKTLADLAILSQGLLKGNELTEFIQRNIDLMEANYKSNLILEV